MSVQHGAIGRHTEYVDCPKCGERVLVYIWSFYGCGKKCPNCGVVFGKAGTFREPP